MYTCSYSLMKPHGNMYLATRTNLSTPLKLKLTKMSIKYYTSISHAQRSYPQHHWFKEYILSVTTVFCASGSRPLFRRGGGYFKYTFIQHYIKGTNFKKKSRAVKRASQSQPTDDAIPTAPLAKKEDTRLSAGLEDTDTSR